MSVQKIFITLITVVACLFIGAFVLNTLLPNSVAQGVNAIESAIYNGTGMSIDLNGDGTTGKNAKAGATVRDSSGATTGSNVGGYGTKTNNTSGFNGTYNK